MAIVCYNKPNRTKARPFTVSDVRRISKIVMDDGVSWMEVLAWSAVGLGVGWFLCRTSQAISRVLKLTSIVRQLALVVATTTALRVLIEFLKGGAVMRVPIINRFALILVVILLLVQKALDVVTNVLDDLLFLDDVVEKLTLVCNYVDEAVGTMVSKGKEDQLSTKDRLLAF